MGARTDPLAAKTPNAAPDRPRIPAASRPPPGLSAITGDVCGAHWQLVRSASTPRVAPRLSRNRRAEQRLGLPQMRVEYLLRLIASLRQLRDAKVEVREALIREVGRPQQSALVK